VTSEPRRRWPPELWLLLALAAAVRFYGLLFGMPHVWARPDELVVCDVAQGFLTGDLNPHFWDYPTLFMYLLAALDYAYYSFGRAAGWFQSLPQFVATWHSNWVPFFVLARVASAIAGTITVAVVYRIAARLFDGLTGGIAALCLALAFLHVRDSHFGVTDVTMVLAIVVSTAYLVRGALDDHRAPFAIAGAIAGAGASIKYNAILMFVPLVAAVLVAGGGRWREAMRRAALFSLLFAGAFFAGSPYAAIDWPSFTRGLESQSRHIATPHGLDLGRGGIYHVAFSLRYGLGLPLLVVGVAGLVWSLRRDWQKGVLLVAFPFAYYAVLAPTRTVFVRYAIPLVPFLCIGAGFAIAQGARAIAGRLRVSATAAAIAIALLVVAPSAMSIVEIDRLFAESDSRLVLADWLRSNVKPGSSIYLGGNIVVQPIVDLTPPRTLHYWTHREGWQFNEDRRPVDGIPDWIVIPETDVPEYSYSPPEVKALARDRYEVARVITAMDLAGNLFDRQDAFYYPFAGFQRARRGGPNYVVYSRQR